MPPSKPRRPRPRRARRARLHIEALEPRALRSRGPAAAPPSFLASEPSDVLGLAQPLGSLDELTDANVTGETSGLQAADVDWYSFTLEQPSRVVLGLSGQPAGVLSL